MCFYFISFSKCILILLLHVQTSTISEKGNTDVTLDMHSDSKQDLVSRGSTVDIRDSSNSTDTSSSSVDEAAEKERKRKLRVGFMMSIGQFSLPHTPKFVRINTNCVVSSLLFKYRWYGIVDWIVSTIGVEGNRSRVSKQLSYSQANSIFLNIACLVFRTFGSTELNFASWMAFNIPGVIINLIFAWLWIQYLFVGFNRYP